MAGERKEIKFYGGGYKEIIEKGIKLGTLRQPSEKYNFKPGEEVMALCEGEGEVLMVVFGSEIRKIKDTPVSLLLLDGFITPRAAVERMNVFYPGTTRSSEMALMTFIDRKHFSRFDKETQGLLITIPQEEAIVMPELRKVFFPSLAWWLAFNGGNAEEWLGFLETQGLAQREEVLDLKQFNREIIEGSLSDPEAFMNMVERRAKGPLGEVFGELVLLET